MEGWVEGEYCLGGAGLGRKGADSGALPCGGALVVVPTGEILLPLSA